MTAALPLERHAELPASRDRPRRVALVGNPNTGKTTVFNALTGLRQKVGNYPGVTVERKTGRLRDGGHEAELIDLPGTYSLRPRSVDERITRDELLGRMGTRQRPDLVVCVVDATNLERNLFLVSQVMDLGLPVVIALNMTDACKAEGVHVDDQALAALLGVPVVPIAAARGHGLEKLKQRVLSPPPGAPRTRWPVNDNTPDETYAQEIAERYAWLGPLCDKVVTEEAGRRPSWERLDAILTHRVLGPVIFLAILALVFESVFAWAAPVMDAVDGGLAAFGAWVGDVMPAGPLRDLVVDGAIAGVGAVLIFMPQILVLFFFLGLLEDTGYMARAAFMMDRLMRKVGLSGRSVVPLLSSYACAIPGIMAARTVENQRDRLITIAVAPLMTCSARLPVYALLIAAFVPEVTVGGLFGLQGLVMLGLYLLGTAMAAVAALVMKRTLGRGERASFFMELPAYRMPRARDILWRMFDRSKIFVVRAGRIILPVSILLWFLASYPKPPEPAPGVAASAASAEAVKHSMLGHIGQAIEPVIAPLGFDWKIGVGLVASFAAREVVVSTLATIYSVGDEVEDSLLIDRIRADTDPDSGEPVFTLLTAISLMVFFVFALQCMSTVAIARRETNSWRWPLFMWAYMLALAWGASFVVYQGGQLLGLG